MTDYRITWKYIVEQMEVKFGIKYNSEEQYSMNEITRYIDKIWDDWFNELYKKENIGRNI